MQLGEQRLGDVSLAGSLEIIQPLFALGLAWRGMGRVVTTEAQCIAMNGDIDVLGETLDQLPGLGQRGAALEGEMLTRRQTELNSLASVQQTQKSFSTATSARFRWAPVCVKISLRRSSVMLSRWFMRSAHPPRPPSE